MTTSPPDEHVDVRIVPRSVRTIETAFGPATIAVGNSDHQVVVTLGPAATDQLARIIAGSAALRDVDIDEQMWTSVMIDLLAGAAHADTIHLDARWVRSAGTAS